MGRMFAEEISGMEIDLEGQIAMHLRANHYPPVPLSMVQPCIEAIDAYWDNEIDKKIQLPEGITWKNQNTAPAYALIDAHHLDPWVTESWEDIDEYILKDIDE
jgi:hypothetical protein